MVAGFADIEHGVEVGSLSAGGEHGSDTAFKSSYLGSNGIVRRVLQAGVEITAVFEVEQTCHLFAGFIFKSGALVDREYTRLSLFRCPAGLHT